jgi:hypothetical protein
MSGRRSGGTQEWLKVIDGGAAPRRDSVTRLHQFQGEHPDVQFTSPTTGPHAQSQYTALIPAGTIPGDGREIITRSADLRGLMDQLDDLFPPPDEDPT